MAMSVGLRRGAWSQDEDTLLRRCVETFGEGRWHQVPLRAGLNRCRKSCRLRWLNYLKPNIKRGEFSHGEIDLMTRLHKLLGNRWALIAGRLPGRTANDVKNYWNTHQKKNSTTTFRCKTLHIDPNSCSKDAQGGLVKITKSNIIKPRPRTLSSKGLFTWPRKITTEPRNPVVVTNKPLIITNRDEPKKQDTSSAGGGEISMWVDSLQRLLDNDDNVGDIGTMKQPVDTVFNYDADQSLWTDIDIRHLLGDYSGHLI